MIITGQINTEVQVIFLFAAITNVKLVHTVLLDASMLDLCSLSLDIKTWFYQNSRLNLLKFFETKIVTWEYRCYVRACHGID